MLEKLNVSMIGAFLLVAAIFPAWGQTYSKIDFPGASSTFPTGINNAGDIVGTYNDKRGVCHGFLLSSGVFTSFDDPSGTSTRAIGINDSGQIVGSYFDPISHRTYGFLLTNGAYTTLQYPNAGFTQPLGINNSGTIVGYFIPRTQYRGFTFSNGVFTAVQPGGSVESILGGINSAGEFSGVSYRGNSFEEGFVSSPSSFHWIVYPNAIFTFATGINDTNQIVGYFEALNLGPDQGFSVVDGKYSIIAFPGAYQTMAFGINNASQIVGYYQEGFDAASHGFLGIP